MKDVMVDKINILFVIVQIDIMGGSERLVYNLALNLDRKIFNPSIAWFYGKNKLEDFENLGIPLYHIPKTKRFDISTMRRFENIIKDNNIHIVNAHHFMSMVYSFYGCKIKNRSKLIYTEHSEWEIEQISWRWERIGSYLLSHSDAAVGVNAKVTNAIQSKFRLHPSKTVTIQNGVDLKVFTKGKNKAGIRRKLGISNNEIVIGNVANLKKIKNHIFLLQTFYELNKDFKLVKLLLIGQGHKGDKENTEDEIKNFINEKGLTGNVLLLGYRSDIPKLLGIMDIFCLTSFKEGLPISLIEAMAAGLPIVGTDVEGIKDVIIHNKNGFLVKIGDVERLKNVLKTLYQSKMLRQKFGYESKSLVTHHYSLSRCVKEYQDLFLSVFGNEKLIAYTKK